MPPGVPTHERPIGTNLLVAEKATRLLHITPVSMGGRPMPPGVAHEGPIGTTSEREAREPKHGNKPATDIREKRAAGGPHEPPPGHMRGAAGGRHWGQQLPRLPLPRP